MAKEVKRNNYDLSGEYGIGYTVDTNEPFYFDLEDYDLIKDCKWSRIGIGYVRAWNPKFKKLVYLHRLIMNLDSKEKYEIDHINHNPFDNRKSNLRICSKSQNNMNKGIREDSSTEITGVRWNKNRRKWESYIMVNQKNIYLGIYELKKEAVRARKKAEEKYFGEYAFRKE